MKKIIILIMTILVTCFVLFLLLQKQNPSARKQVDVVSNELSTAVMFIEDNKEVLDLLLNIQARMEEYNDNELRVSDTSLLIDMYIIEIYQGNLDILTYMRKLDSILVQNDSDIEILFNDSEQMAIQNMLMNLMQHDSAYLCISVDTISIRFYNYHDTTLYISHPSVEIGYSGRISNHEYESATRVSDDWCTRIFKPLRGLILFSW